MATKALRVGIIGVGGIAQECHLDAWKQLEAEGRVELTTACDLINDRVKMVAEKWAIPKIYTSAKRMLNNGEFDIIDVCTQNRGHAPLTIAALQAGAHVIVEKPMAMSAKECQAMIAAAKKADRKLMTAQHMRFEARSVQIKNAVQKGNLGEIYYANATMLRRRGIPGWGKFHIKRESLGGPLIDIGVHVMDLAIWLMGCPKPIAASGKVYRKFGDRKDLCNGEWGQPYPLKEFDVEDFAAAFVRFENNITMNLQCSWAANIPEEDRFEIAVLGDKAGASIRPPEKPGLHGYEKGALTSTTYDWLAEIEGHHAEIRHFTECIEKDEPVLVQPEESLRLQKIIDAIYESSKKNKEIRIR